MSARSDAPARSYVGEIVEAAPPNELFSNPKTDRLKLFLSQILRGH